MRVGIIGSGFGLYGLLPAFNNVRGCNVVAICGKKTDRLTKYCGSIGLQKIYSNWEDMLEKEQLDAVAIAVVPSAQYAIAKKVIQKGLHVFAEKPLTAKYEEAKELALVAKKKKVTTMVDFIFPEIDEWQKAKQILDSKKYGELKHISVVWDFVSYDIKNHIDSWKTDVKRGGGALAFYSSHTLYYLEYFAGAISKVSSILSYSPESKNGAETGVDTVMKYKNGVTGTMHVSCNTPGISQHVITFICEKATIILESNKGVTDNFTLRVCTNTDKKVIKIKKQKTVNNEDERVRIVKKLATRFIIGCKNSQQVIPSFKEGERVQKLIEDIRKAL